MKASIIISFYNNTRNLDLVLAGFERQSEKDFEILIADDGSGEEATEWVSKTIRNSPLNIRHIWHEDKGWRKTATLNQAVRKTETGYLIFIDGDCIPHRKFVLEHLRNQKKGTILSGRRLNLSEKISCALTPEVVRKGFLEKNILTWLFKGLSGEITHAEKGMYLPWLTPVLKMKKKIYWVAIFQFIGTICTPSTALMKGTRRPRSVKIRMSNTGPAWQGSGSEA